MTVLREITYNNLYIQITLDIHKPKKTLILDSMLIGKKTKIDNIYKVVCHSRDDELIKNYGLLSSYTKSNKSPT